MPAVRVEDRRRCRARDPPPAPTDIKTIEELSGRPAARAVSQPWPGAGTALGRRSTRSRRFARQYRPCAARRPRRGLIAQAERRLELAVERLFHNYTRPRDGEAYYYLGLVKRALGKESEAADAFERASWTHGWAAAGNFALAESASRRKDYAKALEYVERSLTTSSENVKALALKAALLRRLDRSKEAAGALATAANFDPLDPWVMREQRLAQGGSREAADAGDPQPYLELALDYGNAGLTDDAVATLGELIESTPDKAGVYPMAYYALGYFLDREDKSGDAKQAWQQGAKAPSTLCFPFRLEEIAILKRALEANPRDARAH